ncbi:putative ferric-chelate reductase 1 homolog [Spodoptera litura]|uniref:Ferric-chelate reductase 1 homolog n=1 Tax=Spodoptera litura TaxID=69820 RepID=A0A9J7ESR9_SPOLT|nr:putative ferric-chelate reductase 1 homolog [Spodoptera litura]XP_022837538.1 putative ferric-chelate reductase 1 homolog [Spodoptera litura]
MLPRKRSAMLLSFVVAMVIHQTEQYGSGAPSGACIDQTPRHESIPAQSSTPPYIILTSTAQVRQGDTLQVTVGSPAGAPLPIGGFILQARQIQNPDVIVGKFVGVPDTTMTHVTTCSNPNDTVTHSSPEDKPAMTFQWQAPTDFLGGIEFRATVAQSYATFWKNVESPLVEVVTPDTVTSAPAAAAPATTRATQPPPVIMESKPKQEAAPLDVVYQGCADTKLCFGVPQNCVTKGDCKAVLAVFVSGDRYTFELQAVGNPKYVAAGLSTDNKMGDDSAMECVRNDNGRVSLFTSWTYSKVDPYVSRSDSPQEIVQLQESSVIDGKLYCKFRRDVVSVVQGKTFDLANSMYNLMVVAGSEMKDANRVGFHDLAYEATGTPMSLATVGTAAASSKLLLKLHGSFMLLAWLGTASLGILLARYFRQTWVGKQLGGKDIWFAYHRIFMVLTWLLTVVGFILILIEVGGWSTTGDNPHAITGIVTVIMCFIQPIGAYFRPHPGTKTRPIFNWAHWLLGNSAHILGIVTIFFAVYLQKAELPSWSVYILAAFVAFHVIMHLVLTLTVCVSDGRISNGRINAFPMKDMLGQTRQATQVDRSTDAPFSRFRRLLLGVYTPVVLIFAIAMVCLVALAPITEVYDTIMGA